MKTNSPIYDALNKAWKATCRVLFGEEIGELKDYDEWLKEYLPNLGRRQSYISGKEVKLAVDDYCTEASFISLDEVKEKALEPLSINEIKDIDTIVTAVSERLEYCGDRLLGKSSNVNSSDLIMDSHYAMESANIYNSLYVFASYRIRENSKYIFGSGWTAASEFLIRFVSGRTSKRCFESHHVAYSSDVYLSHNCINCSDLMFSFHQRNKRNMIGNLEIPKDKFLSLKRKLLEEVKEKLKQNKKFPSLMDLIPKEKKIVGLGDIQSIQEHTDFRPVEKSFSSTFKILFKKEPESITKYEDWLSKYIITAKEMKTPFGSNTLIFAGKGLSSALIPPEGRAISIIEAMKIGSIHLEEEECSSLASIIKGLSKIGYFTNELSEGKLSNVIKSLLAYNASNVYKVCIAVNTDNSAVCYQPLGSKYLFGSSTVIDSQFCIKCYNSSSLNRCFETDTSERCSDTYFAHNCEGLQDAMFCWNAKGKRYAIGNAQLPPDQYRKIKDMLVEQMADEILKKKELKYDIFNIGCAGK